MKEVGQILVKETSYKITYTDTIQIDQQNVDLSIESFLNNMKAILDSNAPFKRVNKYKLRFKTKPWITLALQKLISVKNSLLGKFKKSKDSQPKEHHHIKYKTYRNTLSTLMKKCKTNYCKHYFETSWEYPKKHDQTCINLTNIFDFID